MPPDGVLMVSAVDIFKTSGGAGGVPPVLYGMEVPAAVSAVIGLDDDRSFLDLDGQFADRGSRRTTGRTSGRRSAHKLTVNPFVLAGGFSPLVTHATLTRDGQHDPRCTSPGRMTRRSVCWRWRCTCWADEAYDGGDGRRRFAADGGAGRARCLVRRLGRRTGSGGSGGAAAARQRRQRGRRDRQLGRLRRRERAESTGTGGTTSGGDRSLRRPGHRQAAPPDDGARQAGARRDGDRRGVRDDASAASPRSAAPAPTPSSSRCTRRSPPGTPTSRCSSSTPAAAPVISSTTARPTSSSARSTSTRPTSSRSTGTPPIRISSTTPTGRSSSATTSAPRHDGSPARLQRACAARRRRPTATIRCSPRGTSIASASPAGRRCSSTTARPTPCSGPAAVSGTPPAQVAPSGTLAYLEAGTGRCSTST